MKVEDIFKLSLKEKWIYLEGYKAAIDYFCELALKELKKQKELK